MWAALLDLGFFLLFTGLMLYGFSRWRGLLADYDDDEPATPGAAGQETDDGGSSMTDRAREAHTNSLFAVGLLIVGLGLVSIVITLWSWVRPD